MCERQESYIIAKLVGFEEGRKEVSTDLRIRVNSMLGIEEYRVHVAGGEEKNNDYIYYMEEYVEGKENIVSCQIMLFLLLMLLLLLLLLILQLRLRSPTQCQ